MVRSLDETCAGLGADGPAWRRVFGPLVRGFDDLADDVLGPIVRGAGPPGAAGPVRAAGGAAGHGAGAALPHPAGPGPLRRLGRPRLPAALPARPRRRVGRDADRGRARARLAGGRGRLGRDHRRAGLAAGRAGRHDRHRAPGAQPRRPARGPGHPLRHGARDRGRGVRRRAARPDPARLPALPPRPGGVQGRPRGARRGAVDLEPARRAGTVHLGGTLEEIAAAEAEVCAGRMPERPFVLVAQQSLADPTRAVGDLQPVWAYAHVPAGLGRTGGAGGPGPARAVRTGAARAGRRVGGPRPGRLRGREPQLRRRRHRGRRQRPAPARGPAAAGGDPYATGVPGVYLCSSSTPPGAGVHGMCGFRAATRALAALRAS